MDSYNLSNLQLLEAESIHIMREVAAEFENPVMLYSIGKDSSVMLRLAQKAFAQMTQPTGESSLPELGVHLLVGKDILTKAYGSTNPTNLVKATIAGLASLRTKEEIAELRGVEI